VGWVRALAAAAFVPLMAWLVVILMLSVLEPWLVSLAQQREAAALDPQTAMSAASLVFVFGAGQVALLIAACVVAFGFRLRGAAPSEPKPATPEPAPAARPPETSRAQRLAFDLQRDQAHAAARLHPLHLAASTTVTAAGAGSAAMRDIPSERPARLGDAYRRPAPASRMVGSRA
jgi:type IV secretion system protein VirB6